MVFHDLQVALRMLRLRPVRSALSLLGVFIGVLALVVLLAVREGLRRQIVDLYGTRGAQVVFLYPGYDPQSRQMGRIGTDDLRRLAASHGVKAALPRLQAPVSMKTVSSADSLQALGIDDQFLQIYGLPVVGGRLMLSDEIRRQVPVCLLSRRAANQFFGSMERALGRWVEIEGVVTEVLGVLDWDERAMRRTGAMDIDVLLPAGRMPHRNDEFLAAVEVRVDPLLSAARAEGIVKESISRGDPARPRRYFIRSLEQSLEQSRQLADRMLAMLLGIAGISLAVGGIGIANIMITSVTERTREIGLRKAVGARRQDILLQFLMESAVLCGVGGFLAVATGGLGVAVVRALKWTTVPLAIPPAISLGCVATALGIGVLSGLYPASRAANLSPAEALRYE